MAEAKAASMMTRVEVLKLGKAETRNVGEAEPSTRYFWYRDRITWAQATLTNKRNNFSTHGIGAAGVTFLLRRQGLTLASALRYRGRHCFITSILPLDAGHLTVEAALVEVSQCEDKTGGRTFPGIVTEKYVRFEREEPYNDNQFTHILVTPKSIRLMPGRLVEVEGEPWHIQTPHELDPSKNEYEIWREVEH